MFNLLLHALAVVGAITVLSGLLLTVLVANDWCRDRRLRNANVVDPQTLVAAAQIRHIEARRREIHAVPRQQTRRPSSPEWTP